MILEVLILLPRRKQAPQMTVCRWGIIQNFTCSWLGVVTTCRINVELGVRLTSIRKLDMILTHAMDSAVVTSCSWSMVKTLKSMRRDLVKHFQSQAQRWANGRYAMEAVEPATAHHWFCFCFFYDVKSTAEVGWFQWFWLCFTISL